MEESTDNDSTWRASGLDLGHDTPSESAPAASSGTRIRSRSDRILKLLSKRTIEKQLEHCTNNPKKQF